MTLEQSIHHDSSAANQDGRPEHRFAYVLSGSEPVYYRMLFLSVSTLRRHHPQAEIIISTDPVTAANEEVWHRIRPIVDCIKSFDVGHPPGAAASRVLKTKLARHLTRPLVFLDVDTLVIRQVPPLSQVLGDADFGAVQDRNRLSPTPVFPSAAAQVSSAFGWKQPTRYYFNSGVTFWADTAAAGRLSDEWHERWQRCLSELGDHRDQPALNSAIEAVGVRVREVSTSLNAMIDGEPRLARNARVVHFFSKGGKPVADTLLAHLLHHLEATHEVDWAAIDRAAERDDYWTRPGRTYARAVAQRHWGRAIFFGAVEAAAEAVARAGYYSRQMRRMMGRRADRVGAVS